MAISLDPDETPHYAASHLDPNCLHRMPPVFKHCNHCQTCRSDHRRCTGCFTVYYCSKDCQRLDWPKHRNSCSTKPGSRGRPENSKNAADLQRNATMDNNEVVCPEVKLVNSEDSTDLTLEEEHILRIRQVQHDKAIEEMRRSYDFVQAHSKPWSASVVTKDFAGSMQQYHQVLTPAQMAVFKKQPKGSLDHAVHHIQTRLPAWNVIQNFNEIPTEYNMYYVSFRRQMKTILVAFMFMYHTHPMRHGVYLKDARGKIMHVEFYFDDLNDDPRPYFTYDQVRPGDYIFIKNPVQHRFGDGVIGFRINHPSEVLFASIDSL